MEDHPRKGSFSKYDQAQRRPPTINNKERATGGSSGIRTIPVEAPSYNIAFKLNPRQMPELKKGVKKKEHRVPQRMPDPGLESVTISGS